jgi:hypothetical protein
MGQKRGRKPYLSILSKLGVADLLGIGPTRTKILSFEHCVDSRLDGWPIF